MRYLHNFARVCLIVCVIPLLLTAQTPTPGQNVNMVSGTRWPGGDPFLQRQNEPSMAVSSRNPQHLLAGANDYRTVDLNILDQLPIDQLAGDAWLGVFKSFDGGRHWASTLLPGFPQDASSFGTSSPLHGFTAASDPVVRAGTNGLFYYSGIAFNRGSNVGIVFTSRFIDLNNKENGDAAASTQPATSSTTVIPTPTDSIRYIGAAQIDKGNSGQFIDKPWLAVDLPRGTATCIIQTDGTTVQKPIPAGNVYIAYAKFVGGTVNVRSKVNFSRSTDCGTTWSNPIMLSQTYAINQGTQIAVDPETGYVYVAWRVFSSGSDPDEIVIAKSVDGGNSFSKAVPVIALPAFNSQSPNNPSFFDQGTTGTSFRTSAVPTLTVDDSGSPSQSGRVYVAWSQRGIGPNGDGRIVLSTSSDGVSGWTSPQAVDNGGILDDAFGKFSRGHQIMPAMTFIQGKLEVLYYDLRLDHTIGLYKPNFPFQPDNSHDGRLYMESRECAGEFANCNDPLGLQAVFGPFIDDAGLTSRRHTMDVMLAQSSGGVAPTFSYARVSQYDFGLPSQEADELEQLKQNPPNLPMFEMGQAPFVGDYVDITGPMFVPSGAGWRYNNPPATSATAVSSMSSPVFYGTWTSNQDVIPPADGNWQHYNPIPLGPTSVYNGSPIPGCQPGLEADRNQNIYESRITQGLLVSSPQNSKPLSPTLQRGFVILTQNFTGTDRTFRLTILNQPPGAFRIAGVDPAITNGYASFQQALPNQPLPNPLPAPVITQDVTVLAHSGVASTVFALSSSPTASITVNVNEMNGSAQGGLSASVVLNADVLNPALIDPDNAPGSTSIANVEIYAPNITTPNITTPNITTPNITTPNITTPNITTPNITTPNITTPNITTPNITTTTVANPNITTPNITTPNITTSTPADATYTLSNKSNTSASYHVHVVGNSPTPLQLIVSQVYATPTSYQCQLVPQQQNITFANVPQVQFAGSADLINPNITTPGVTDAVVEIAPGDSVFVTLRGLFDTANADDAKAQMQVIATAQATPVVTAQAVSTNSTATVPVISAPPTTPLTFLIDTIPSTMPGRAYQTSIPVTGGTPPYHFAVSNGALPSGITLSPDGVLLGSATQSGAFGFSVALTDSGSPAQAVSGAFTLIVSSPQVFFSPQQPSGIIAGQSFATTVTVRDPSGAPIANARVALTLAAGPSGATLSPSTATAATDATGHAQFTNLHLGPPGSGYVLQASVAAPPSPVLTGFTDSFTVTSPPLMFQTGSTLPTAFVATPYNSPIGVIGGTPPYHFFPSANPPGLVLDPVTGILSGTASADFAFGFSVRVTDSSLPQQSVSQDFGIVALTPNVTIAPLTPTGIVAGVRMSAVTATVIDNQGGPIAGARVTVVLGMNGPGAVLGGTTALITDAQGQATFTDLTINMPFRGYILQAFVGTHSADTNAFSVAGFKATGPMAAGRYLHTATKLSDGRVLITGGQTVAGASLNSATLYNPVVPAYSPVAPMNAPRSGHTATLFTSGPLSGKVLIVGGLMYVGSQAQARNDAEIFDPATGIFTALSSTLGTPRAFHTATLVTSGGNAGKVLIAGGRFYDGDGSVQTAQNAELFDPGNGGFAFVPDPANPVFALPFQPRQEHTATTLPNGDILLAGGKNQIGTNAPPQQNTEVYHVGSGTISSVGAYGAAAAGQNSVLLPSGTVLITGGLGISSQPDGDLFDRNTGLFTLTTEGSRAMTIRRYLHTLSVVGTTQLLIAGGENNCGAGLVTDLPLTCNTAATLSSSELYDTVSGTFSPGAAMSSPRAAHTATVLNDGTILVVGGSNDGGATGLATSELYVH